MTSSFLSGRSTAGGPARRRSIADEVDKRKLGLFTVVLSVVAAAAPLTVAWAGATSGWATTGVLGIPLAYTTIAVVLSVFAVGFVAMSRRIVNAGAFYAFVTRGIGPVFGLGIAFMALLAYLVMLLGLIDGFGYYGADFIARVGDGEQRSWWVTALAAVVIIGIIGISRVKLTGTILSIALTAEIVLAVIFAVVQVEHPAAGMITFDTVDPHNLAGAGIGPALATAFAGFIGVEITLVFSEETRNARKNTGRATFLAIFLIGALYTFVTWAISVAAGPDKIVAMSAEHFGELPLILTSPYVPAFWIFLGRMLLCTSIFAAALAFHNTLARYLFSLGREHVLPSFFGRQWERTDAHLGGSLTASGLSAIGVLVFAYFGWDPLTRGFFWLTVLGGYGVLVMMLITSVAVIFFFRRPSEREHATAWQGLGAPLLAAGALGAVFWVTTVNFQGLLGNQDGDISTVLLPASFAVAAGLGMLWAVVLYLRRRDIYRRIGEGASEGATLLSGGAPA